VNGHTLSAEQRPDSTALPIGRYLLVYRRDTAAHNPVGKEAGGAGWDECPNQPVSTAGGGTGQTRNSKVAPDPLVQAIASVPGP
jgi:hypothetical protein